VTVKISAMPRSDLRHWWITLALTVFGAFFALGLAGGIARADDDTGTGTGNEAASSATSDSEPAEPKSEPDTESESEQTPATTLKGPRPKTRPYNRVTKETRPQSLSVVNDVSRSVRLTAHPAKLPTPEQAIRQARRQLTGLTRDVAAVVASAVHSFAAGTAAVVGPNTLGGLPYSVARTVQRTAAQVSRQLTGTTRIVATTGRFRVNFGVFDTAAFWRPWKSPAGADDPDIHYRAGGPLPVILINGTTETRGFNWSVGAPVLANAGYKVYTFNYGSPHPSLPFQSSADIRSSARQLDAEVQRVLAATGAPKVVLVGHSQGGGILPSYYINRMDGADKVSHLIGIAPSNHGTDFNSLAGVLRVPVLGAVLRSVVNVFGPAFMQQMDSSPFQREVYGDGDTRPGVVYTTIASNHDEIVTPYTRQALDGPNVTNIVMQDQYPGYTAGHLGMLVTPQLWDTVLAALAVDTQVTHQQDLALIAA
jgi:triacylglycerol esterase/lipase EstA (alpha/beta hydrolase family)